MSDCLHCEIHEMLESHLQNEQADLAEIAASLDFHGTELS
jgi:hypothetical protein